MVVLVTGGSGLVGSALREIAPDFVYMKSSYFNLISYEETENMFKRYRPETVIHLAANVGGLYKNMNNKIQMFEDNMRINLNVISLARKYGVKKVISCLSTCVFPDCIISDTPDGVCDICKGKGLSYSPLRKQYVGCEKCNDTGHLKSFLNEEMLHDGPPHFSNEGYAYAKRMLEVHSRLCRESGLDYVCIIPTNIYGPNDNFSLENAHVIPALIHQASIAKDGILKVRGTGKAYRQFIFSRDLAKLILEILGSKNIDSIILADEKEYQIGSIAQMIADVYGLQIEYDEKYADGQTRKAASIDKLRHFFPNFQFTPIGDGLKETINWFEKNYVKNVG